MCLIQTAEKKKEFHFWHIESKNVEIGPLVRAPLFPVRAPPITVCAFHSPGKYPKQTPKSFRKCLFRSHMLFNGEIATEVALLPRALLMAVRRLIGMNGSWITMQIIMNQKVSLQMRQA